MIKPNISTNADKIWILLDINGELSYSEIQEQMNLEESSLCLALGWLAREGKIFFYKKRNALLICPVE